MRHIIHALRTAAAAVLLLGWEWRVMGAAAG